MFDPATMRNAPVRVEVGRRELVRVNDRPLPAFRVELSFGGLQTTSWVTDTGEVVREESPMGLLTVAETSGTRHGQGGASRHPGRSAGGGGGGAAVSKQRIEEPRDVQRLRLRLEGADLSSADLQGVGQRVDGDVIEIVDARGPGRRSRAPRTWRVSCSRSRSSKATPRRSAPRPRGCCTGSTGSARSRPSA